MSDPIKPTLESVEAEGRRVGEAVGRALTAAASAGALLPGQTAASPNLNAAQIARHRSGTQLTYSERKATMGARVSAELDGATLAKLDALCDDGGMSRADMIRAMIDAEWAEWVTLRPSRREP